MASFPGAVATLSNPTGADFQDVVDHAAQHSNANDEIEATQTKIGTGASTPDTNKILLGTGPGASLWSDPAAVRTALGLVIGTNVQAFASVPSYDSIQFPAVQVPSAGANVFDDYEEGLWTPALTTGTPGTLVSVLAIAAGWYVKKGREVTIGFRAQTSTWTLGTASGNFKVTGCPFSPLNTVNLNGSGAAAFRGWTKANFTQITAFMAPNDLNVYFYATGSGQTLPLLQASEILTGGPVDIIATLAFQAAN